MNLEYINKVAPEHDRTSCNDKNMSNARFAPDDFGGCYRCTLLAAAVQTEAQQSEKDAERYRWLRDWFIRGGKRSEIHPMGHIQTTTPEIVDANIDAAIAKEKYK